MRYQSHPSQPQWQTIEAENPDYLFLLGDQIYMDYGIFSAAPIGFPKFYSDKYFERTMNRHYAEQWREPNFKQLFEKMKAKNAIFGVWDDHDFAWNGAYGNAVSKTKKEIARKLFHHWMDCSTNRPEVYCHIDIAQARVIFLDTRYYADPKRTEPRQLLGEKQFEFLEQSLDHNLPYTILCSGITLTHGTENWGLFKQDYARLRALLAGRERVLFLAGDIHKNKFALPDATRPCYEIVSSGLAVNYLGLPGTGCHNWGVLEIDELGISVKLVDKRREQLYRIDSTNWHQRTFV